MLKAPTTALESAANCVELNAPICVVVSEVPTALSWSEVKVPMSLVEIAPNWALLSVPMTVLVRPEACPGGDRGDLGGAEAAGEGGDLARGRARRPGRSSGAPAEAVRGRGLNRW